MLADRPQISIANSETGQPSRSTLDPKSSEDSTARQVLVPIARPAGDDAEASISRTASNLPATKPHIATASTVSLQSDLRAEQH
jgi:hypothetical protein